MRITYYALRDVRVGDEVRQPSDLIPEACMWPYLSGYITDGKIAPVLVSTLPEEQQIMLLEWEEDVLGVVATAQPVEDVPEPEEVEEINKDGEGVEPDESVPLDAAPVKRVVKKPTTTKTTGA